MPLAAFSLLHIYLFKLRHILIGHTKICFCEMLTFNHFLHTFVHFNIVVLNRYDFISYSVVLPMSISARFFHALIIYCRCIIYVTI